MKRDSVAGRRQKIYHFVLRRPMRFNEINDGIADYPIVCDSSARTVQRYTAHSLSSQCINSVAAAGRNKALWVLNR